MSSEFEMKPAKYLKNKLTVKWEKNNDKNDINRT